MTIAAIWQQPVPSTIYEQLDALFAKAAEKDQKIQLLFRADDIGRNEPRFQAMMELFIRHRMPLCLAVVPTWFNEENRRSMDCYSPQSSLWCWHQHGYSHHNHQRQGKKAEFGTGRSLEAIAADLRAGQQHLQSLLGGLFCPVFTPPWNRCSPQTLELLVQLGFAAISRSAGAKPLSPPGLRDLAVNVDLHTRKEGDSQQGWNRLLVEFADGIASGRLFIMLHHLCMNSTGIDFLDKLLELIHTQTVFQPVHFTTLLQETPDE
jgi:peptidoglycan/xylan/chitin deacetylase (PgdA/CDA1 family)